MGWSDFRDSIVKPALGAAAGFALGGPAGAAKGASLVSGLEASRQSGKAASSLAQTAADQRQSAYDAQAQAAESQAARFEAESNYLKGEQTRYNTLYKPIEQGIAEDLAQGPQTEQAATIAGSTFANQFDAEIAARERNQLQQGIDYRAGSSAERMQGENDAYNRAMGIATSQTSARREEDDQHFLQSTAFYNANGAGIKNQLLQGMQTMYGADYEAARDQASYGTSNAALTQEYSNAMNAQSNSSLSSVFDAGTQLFKAAGGISGITDTLGGLFSDDPTGGTGAVGVTQPAGVQSTGVTTFGTSTPQAIRTNTPKMNQYMNDGTYNQNRAAISGTNRGFINTAR